MSDRTSLLFALPGFRVLDVSPDLDGGRRVVVEAVSVEGVAVVRGGVLVGEGPAGVPSQGPALTHQECARGWGR